MCHLLAGVWLHSMILCLSACVAYDGHRLLAGGASVNEVIAEMGPPAMRWQDADGSEQLAYPRGPMGVHTYMVYLAPDKRLARIENALVSERFAQVRPGEHDQNAILRLFGPPNPVWTVYYEARDELAWQWLICDDWNRLARFSVLFDGKSSLVRSTLQVPEWRGRDGVAPWCSH